MPRIPTKKITTPKTIAKKPVAKTTKKSTQRGVRNINLALQGGGAHGAYTWGVLDRLLEEERLHIEGISGTSAGAMNGAILINGYVNNGRQGARDALDNFWGEVSELGQVFNPVQQNPFEQFNKNWNLDWSLSYNFFDMLSRTVSPYQFNPLNLNPLRDLLERTINVNKCRTCSEIKLFVAATHVESGQAKIFQGKELSIDAVLASACIPFIFQAVLIKGEAYWDGGYMGNPVIWPMLYGTETEDILLVQLNPLFSEGVPRQSHEIINRLNEITFNSSLMAEMRAINFVKKLIDDGKLSKKEYKDVRMHMISAPTKMRDFDASSKMNTQWAFFSHLKELGRAACERWLKHHLKDVGHSSTIDIWDTFLKPRIHAPRDAA